MTERNERRLSDQEIADLVAEEFARPLNLADPADQDAFDFFAHQDTPAQRPDWVGHISGALFTIAIVGFVASLTILLALGDVSVSFGFALVSCGLCLTGTLLAVFVR